jgi:hypothetical protein
MRTFVVRDETESLKPIVIPVACIQMSLSVKGSHQTPFDFVPVLAVIDSELLKGFVETRVERLLQDIVVAGLKRARSLFSQRTKVPRFCVPRWTMSLVAS